MPSSANHHATAAHATIRAFLNGTIDNLGQTLSGLFGHAGASTASHGDASAAATAAGNASAAANANATAGGSSNHGQTPSAAAGDHPTGSSARGHENGHGSTAQSTVQSFLDGQLSNLGHALAGLFGHQGA